MAAKRVLSIGQCGADSGAISRTLTRNFPVEVVSIDTGMEALEQLQRENFDLVLVNRVLDADGSSGLNVIRELKADEDARRVPVMLVSNYSDAQQQAVELGALPGFGKSSLGQPAMLARVRSALNVAPA